MTLGSLVEGTVWGFQLWHMLKPALRRTTNFPSLCQSLKSWMTGTESYSSDLLFTPRHSTPRLARYWLPRLDSMACSSVPWPPELGPISSWLVVTDFSGVAAETGVGSSPRP